MKRRFALLLLLMIGLTAQPAAPAERDTIMSSPNLSAPLAHAAGRPQVQNPVVAGGEAWARAGDLPGRGWASSPPRFSSNRALTRLAQGGSTIPPSGSATMPGETFRDCPECPEMVVIPTGEFEMGANELVMEKPVHRVAIGRPIAVGRREVTFAEWDQCVAAGACKYRPDDRGWGRGDRPVIDVSWDDAKVFLDWLSRKTGQRYRFPTEAEWEYAARGGTTTPFWWGRNAGTGYANCEDCGPPGGGMKTTPAGSFRPNAFGLYDTAGNAAEWVEDCWNDSYRSAPKDGAAWTAGQCNLRVLRGGSFGSKASAIRSAARFRYDKDVRYFANGFRAARDL